MSVSIRPPLLTMASDLDEPEPWVMTASPGAVLIAPIRLMTARQRLATATEDLVLGLTDLGFLGGTNGPAIGAGDPQLTAPRELVLLLPTELLEPVAHLRRRAVRLSEEDIGSQLHDRDAWLATWHHFVDTKEGLGIGLLDQSRLANGDLRILPCDASRRYVFATPHDTELSALLDRFGGLKTFALAEQFDHRHPSFSADGDAPGCPPLAGATQVLAPAGRLHLLEEISAP
jgi:hypothetical protein